LKEIGMELNVVVDIDMLVNESEIFIGEKNEK
jgi:hypothetical protein